MKYAFISKNDNNNNNNDNNNNNIQTLNVATYSAFIYQERINKFSCKLRINLI